VETQWFDERVEIFFVHKRAEGLKRETETDYRRTFGYLREWIPLGSDDIKGFFAWLRDRPNGNDPQKKLSPKTIYNAFVALKSFYRWLSDEEGVPNPMDRICTPRVPEPVINPLSEEQVKAVLKACERDKPTQRGDQRPFSRLRPTRIRDRAIVIVLLDTGLRASELCRLRVEDIDLGTGRALVREGKGGKGRVVYLGTRALSALVRNIKGKREGAAFTTTGDSELDRGQLRHLISRLGERAGIESLHPHRFRHTFATEFLRNGGGLLPLQRILGHSSLEMVRRYARIVDSDLARAHGTGSPVDRWRL
jgi:integrase/recombinase XerD